MQSFLPFVNRIVNIWKGDLLMRRRIKSNRRFCLQTEQKNLTTSMYRSKTSECCLPVRLHLHYNSKRSHKDGVFHFTRFPIARSMLQINNIPSINWYFINLWIWKWILPNSTLTIFCGIPWTSFDTPKIAKLRSKGEIKSHPNVFVAHKFYW